MLDHALPLAYAALVWFFGTGIVLWLDRRPRLLPQALMLGTLGGGVALWAVDASARMADASAAFVGFTAAIFLWGLHELSFLSGLITGPRRAPLPPGTTGFARFRLATLTLIHHELALALTLALIAGVTAGAPNPIAAQTFGLLFAMRVSAKINLFIGTPHADTSMLPPQLAYLKSYFGRARVNALLPQSIVACAALAYVLGRAAIGATAPAHYAGYMLLLGLTILGLIEHVFLAMPLRDSRLWRWAMPGKAPAVPPPGAAATTGRV